MELTCRLPTCHVQVSTLSSMAGRQSYGAQQAAAQQASLQRPGGRGQFPPHVEQQDPLRNAIRGSKVALDDHDLRTSVAGIATTAKLVPDAAFLRVALAKVPMLEGVSAQQIDRIIGAMEASRSQPREAPVRFGQRNDFMYVIQSGRVSLSGPATNVILQDGDTFGAEALDTAEPAEYTAVCGGSCQMWRIHRRTFKLLQMDYGSRLRYLIQHVVDQNREKAAGQMSAMQQIVVTAMERKREAELINKSLVWQEFADVAAAIEHMTFVAAIGKGAFGEVQLGVHAPTRKPYALKTQNVSGDVRLRRNIDREIEAMRNGASPFLMRFYGEIEEGGISRMLLEYLGGGSCAHTARSFG